MVARLTQMIDTRPSDRQCVSTQRVCGNRVGRYHFALAKTATGHCGLGTHPRRYRPWRGTRRTWPRQFRRGQRGDAQRRWRPRWCPGTGSSQRQECRWRTLLREERGGGRGWVFSLHRTAACLYTTDTRGARGRSSCLAASRREIQDRLTGRKQQARAYATSSLWHPYRHGEPGPLLTSERS